MYLRWGAAWSDRVILSREELIQKIKTGKRIMTGQRVEFMAGTFNISHQVKVTGPAGQEILVSGLSNENRDHLEDVPVL